MTPPCPHGAADPRMCMECRRERTDRPMPGQGAAGLAAPAAPGAVVDLDTRTLGPDLQALLGRIRYVAFTWEDAAALYKAATRHRAAGRLPADVTYRVAAALSEAFATSPGLRPERANAVHAAETGMDHGSKSALTGGDRDPDPP